MDFLRNLHLFLIPRLLRPAATIRSLRELSAVLAPEIKGLILDVDQTIIPFNRNVVSRAVVGEIDDLRRSYACCLLSNVSRDPKQVDRLNRIASQVGLTAVFADRLKPDVGAFRCALRVLGLRAGEVAVVGDRIFTDIVGANHASLVAIRIQPLDPSTDPFWSVRLSRFAEISLSILYETFRRKGEG